MAEFNQTRRGHGQWATVVRLIAALGVGVSLIAFLVPVFSRPSIPIAQQGNTAGPEAITPEMGQPTVVVPLSGGLETSASEQFSVLDGRQLLAGPASLDVIQSTAEIQGLAENQGNPMAVVAGPWPDVKMKHVIGATTTVLEPQSDLFFQARVDTGASTCSLHVEKIVIAGEVDEMDANVGKKIRFKVMNTDGESGWINSIIDCCANIKTPDNIERRYKVPLSLHWNGFAKSVLVTLNDRTKMKYPLLLGRNFLEADFVVDIELGGEL